MGADQEALRHGMIAAEKAGAEIFGAGPASAALPFSGIPASFGVPIVRRLMCGNGVKAFADLIEGVSDNTTRPGGDTR
jgi:hypothetical protein